MTHETADARIVDAVCRRVADAEGDPGELVAAELRRLAPLCSPDQRQALHDAALAELVGLGELDRFVRDPDVDDVLVTAETEVWVDRRGRLDHVATLAPGRAAQLVERAIAPLGRRLDRTSPIVDARLPGGQRLCAVLAPVAVDGTAVAIRTPRDHAVPLDAFVEPEGARLLHDVVEQRCNVVVSGATSAGKTTLLAALVELCAADERLVVVEDTTELVVRRPHAVRLEARPAAVDGPAPVDLAQLVRTALRLRPDRMVVGEVRGDESLALMQAMNTGHDGSWSTCHANGPVDALWRLESLVLQASPSWPLASIRAQLARSLDVIVHVERCGDERRVHSIAEVAVVPGADVPEVTVLAERVDGALRVVAPLTRGRRP